MERLTRNPPRALLGVALAGSAALTLILTARLTFFGDTWEFLMNRRDFSVDALLKPHNEHIVLFPVTIEQLFLRLFGMTSATPEFVLLTLGLLATACLLFVYVERRVGPWLALFAAVLVLFLGPAWEVLLWPFEIGFVGSVLFGLATLLALERGDRRGDVAACAFLVLALGFSSLGIAFAVGAAIALLQAPRQSWRGRAYVVVLPALLFAAWYLGWGHEAESHFSLHNLLASPRFVAEEISIAVGSLAGLGNNPTGEAADPIWGRAILVALVLVFAFRQYRKPGFFPGLWPVAAAAATNWFLTAFNQFPGREPTASRYVYASAIFVLLILANLLQGVRIGRRGVLIAAAVTVLAVGPNLVVLKYGKDWFQGQTTLTRADTGALEIARRTVAPEFQLSPEVAGTPTLVDVTAEKYFPAVDEYGSPAYSPAELVSAPEEGRRQADVVLARALPITAVTRLGAFAPESAAENCVSLPAGSQVPASGLHLSPGLARVELAPGPAAGLALRRFAIGEYPVVLTEAAPGDSATILRIPRDESHRSWFLHVGATQAARVCR